MFQLFLVQITKYVARTGDVQDAPPFVIIQRLQNINQRVNHWRMHTNKNRVIPSLTGGITQGLEKNRITLIL